MCVVYISTVFRGAPIRKGGQIIKLDWKTKKILGQSDIWPQQPAVKGTNLRRGARGSRGITKLHNKIFVASYHSIYVFTPDLELLNIIRNKNFVGLHEIDNDGEYLYVTSTKIDTLIKLTSQGKVVTIWSLRDAPKLQQLLRLTPLNLHTDN